VFNKTVTSVEMDLKVKCPNPECRHHKRPFVVDALREFVKLGGQSRWKKMSQEEKDKHIAMMNRARLKAKKTPK
jgi:hypothetical protein